MIADLSRTLPSVSPVFREHAHGLCLAIAIVGELFARFRLMRSIEDSPELLAYKRFEILSAGALLGLTAYCSKKQFTYGLGTITFFALEQLYRTGNVTPGWAKLFRGEWELDNQETRVRLREAQASCQLLQSFIIIYLASSSGVFALQHLGQVVKRTTAFCLLPVGIAVLAKQILLPNYLNSQHDAFVVTLKVERLVLSLETLRILALTNCVGIAFALLDKGLEMIPFKNIKVFLRPTHAAATFSTLGAGILLISVSCWLTHQWQDFHIFNILNSRASGSFFDALTSSPVILLNNMWAPFTPRGVRAMIGLTRPIIRHVDVLDNLAEGHVEEERIRKIFHNIAPLMIRYKTINFIEKYPQILTPHFLSSDKRLWEVFTAEQVDKYLLTPELKALSEEDGLKMLSTQMDALSQKIAALKQVPPRNEAEWLAAYDQLRPLYKPLDTFACANLLQTLKSLPENAQAARLVNQLKTSIPLIEETSAKITDLEDQLNELTGDLFKDTCESLSTVTAAVLNNMFQAWGKATDDGPFLRIQTLFKKQGILWKGDLIHTGILQQGQEPDNSLVALTTRLSTLLGPAETISTLHLNKAPGILGAQDYPMASL